MAREPAVIEVDLAPIDLDALATDCWESGDFGDPPADATLVVEEVGPIAADRDLLRRAIGNLLGNAFDHAGGDAPRFGSASTTAGSTSLTTGRDSPPTSAASTAM